MRLLLLQMELSLTGLLLYLGAFHLKQRNSLSTVRTCSKWESILTLHRILTAELIIHSSIYFLAILHDSFLSFMALKRLLKNNLIYPGGPYSITQCRFMEGWPIWSYVTHFSEHPQLIHPPYWCSPISLHYHYRDDPVPVPPSALVDFFLLPTDMGISDELSMACPLCPTAIPSWGFSIFFGGVSIEKVGLIPLPLGFMHPSYGVLSPQNSFLLQTKPRSVSPGCTEVTVLTSSSFLFVCLHSTLKNSIICRVFSFRTISLKALVLRDLNRCMACCGYCCSILPLRPLAA